MIRSTLPKSASRFEPVSRLVARLGVVVIGSTALLLSLTGVGFADGSSDINTTEPAPG
jgi:hypothetical protein